MYEQKNEIIESIIQSNNNVLPYCVCDYFIRVFDDNISTEGEKLTPDTLKTYFFKNRRNAFFEFKLIKSDNDKIIAQFERVIIKNVSDNFAIIEKLLDNDIFYTIDVE